jgi:uncharacterized protein YciI
MPYFFCKLLPPRPTFIADMTDAERAVMGQHVAYWTGLLQDGQAIVFGPVADPAGAFGMGVLSAADAAAAEQVAAQDPAMLAGMGFDTRIFPMPTAVHAGA